MVLRHLLVRGLEMIKKKMTAEIESIIKVAKAGYADIVAVGNEVLLRGDLTEDEIIKYIQNS